MGPIVLLLALLLPILRPLDVLADISIKVDVASVAVRVPAPITWTRRAQDPSRFALQSVVFGTPILPFTLVEVDAGTELQGSVNVVSLHPGPHTILAFVSGNTQTISTSNVFDVIDPGEPAPSSSRQTVTTTLFSTDTSIVYSPNETGSINSEEAVKNNCQQKIIGPSVLAAVFGVATVVLTFILLRSRRPSRSQPHPGEPEAQPSICSVQHQPVWSPQRLEDQVGSPFNTSGTYIGTSDHTYQTTPSQSAIHDPRYTIHRLEERVRELESRQVPESSISEASTAPPPLYRKR